MKTVFFAILAFAQISFAGLPAPAPVANGSDLATLQKILGDDRVAQALAGQDITNISVSKSSVSTITKYSVVITYSEPGLSFPNGQPSSHPCSVFVTAAAIGGVAGTDFQIDEPEVVCAANGINLGLSGN